MLRSDRLGMMMDRRHFLKSALALPGLSLANQTKRNVLFIADEVMTGFCRTGKMFAIEHWNLEPDMICMSKGLVTGYLPFGVLAVSGKIFNAMSGSYFPVGSTESGNPICCAIGNKCIEIYNKEITSK